MEATQQTRTNKYFHSRGLTSNNHKLAPLKDKGASGVVFYGGQFYSGTEWAAKLEELKNGKNSLQ